MNNLPSLDRALTSLDVALDLPRDEVVRDAAIQRFKVAYELASRIIRHYLTEAGASDADSLTPRNLFRESAKIGLIADAEAWFNYAFARNLIPQAYEEIHAEEVYLAARRFAVDARRLWENLKKRTS